MRRPSVASQYKQVALELVMPTRKRLGDWSQQAAYIAAIAHTGRADTTAVVSQAKALLDDIAHEREAICLCISEQPDEVRTDSRVTDAIRSLDALKTSLSEAIATLLG